MKPLPTTLRALAGLILCTAVFAHDPVAKESHWNGILAQPDSSLATQAMSLCERAVARAEQGDRAGAFADFSEALRLDPSQHGIWRVRGRVLAEQGSLGAAKVDLERYLAWHPEDGEARWALGSVLWAEYEQDPAQVAFAAASARTFEATLPTLQERRPHHFVQLAKALDASGDCEGALECIDSGLSELAGPVSLLEVGARLAERQSRPSQAARYWTAAALAAPNHALYRLQAAAFGAFPLGARALASQPASQRFALNVQLPLLTPIDSQALAAVADLIPFGADWKYLDNGSNQGSAWRFATLDDSSWASGPGELGYGDGDEATVLSYGPSSSNKYITSYFRHTFLMPSGVVPRAAWVDLVRDDGAVVYLNGVEIQRSNMQSGAISYLTLAPVAVGGEGESTFERAYFDPALLQGGNNLVAVEVHQSGPTSSDISFHLRLQVARYAAVSRGPYLQMGTPNGAVVRWSTYSPTDTALWLGTAPGNLSVAYQNGVPSTEHEVILSGLNPASTYYYGVGRSQGPLLTGPELHFQTAPAPTSTAPVRIWAIGDAGTGNADALAVYNAYRTYTGATPTDVWLMLGDNAYNSGTDSEYQTAVFDTYRGLLHQAFVWPTLGNHDGLSASSATESGVYYNVFTLPRQGECGGVPSGTEAYYSFDYGAVHFICLDSEGSSLVPTSPMLAWLQADLAQRTQPWTIVFWHHPPYTKGSHNSDDLADSGGRMAAVRANVLPILDAAGVDLVLSGHSHSYERSFLLDGHYGLSSTLLPSMVLDGGNGGTDGAYEKATVGAGPHEGVVYTVAGSSGKIGGGPLNHAAMHISLNVLGSVVLDVVGDTLTARFLDSTGAVLDEYSVVKG